MMLLGEGFEGLTAAAAGVEALAGVLLFFDFFSPVATVTKYRGMSAAQPLRGGST